MSKVVLHDNENHCRGKKKIEILDFDIRHRMALALHDIAF